MSLAEKIDRKDKILGNLSTNLAGQIKAKSADNYTLENLSASLVLSLERSKLIYELYEKNNSLKDKSDRLIRALNEEKHINNLQSEFVSLVSHEFKTPLAIIKMAADVLNRINFQGKEEQELLKKQLDKISKSIMRMNNLIETTLNLSKLETGKLQFTPSIFSLKDLLVEIIERFQGFSPDATYELNLGEEAALFNGDKSLIDQVFMNLFSNAIKYSKKSAKISVSLDVFEGFYHIAIEDNGIGMGEKDLEKLFSKFFRAKNSVGIAGTGMGLYLVKQFLDLHNGDIEVNSKEGVGTEFVIKLPIE